MAAARAQGKGSHRRGLRVATGGNSSDQRHIAPMPATPCGGGDIGKPEARSGTIGMATPSAAQASQPHTPS
jgi:hypothetical protein